MLFTDSCCCRALFRLLTNSIWKIIKRFWFTGIQACDNVEWETIKETIMIMRIIYNNDFVLSVLEMIASGLKIESFLLLTDQSNLTT